MEKRMRFLRNPSENTTEAFGAIFWHRPHSVSELLTFATCVEILLNVVPFRFYQIGNDPFFYFWKFCCYRS